MTYPRGSEWRRWDLHVHAPETALEDKFTGWKDYLKAVERADPSIAVLGITDYSSIKTYKQFKEYHKAGRAKNITLAIPNIEFRISPETKEGKGINLHLLVSPDDDDHVDRIEEALGRLKIKRHGEDIPCSRSGLARLGILTKSNLKSSPDAAYEEGVNQFKVDFEHFRNWFTSEEWLSRNSLVAVAAGSNDGASGLKDGGYQSTRREMYAFAQLILSGNPKERDSWLGRGSIPESEFKLVRLPKPVIHGSDAHELSKLFHPEQNRYCWIKSDPTFEGLRQIVYEPDDRVWIGERPPTTHDERSVIDRLVIANARDWFDENREIPLNPGLVAIIGLKGSGKTALADMIAFSGGAALDEQNSFLGRAEEHISGLSTLLVMNDGSVQSAEFPSQPRGTSESAVRYLSQKFVDNLCSGDALSDELQHEIESVIFAHLDVENRLDANSFDELRHTRTQSIQATRTETGAAIQEESELIGKLDERRATILKTNVRRLELPQLIEKVAKSMPNLNDKEATKRVTELQKLNEKLTKLQQSIATTKADKQRVTDIERQITQKRQELERFWSATEANLEKLGFTTADIAKLAPQWLAHPEIFRSRTKQMDDAVAASQGSKPTGDGTVAGLTSAVAKLEEGLKLDKANKAKVLALERQRKALMEEKRKLDADFQWAEKAYKAERQQSQSRRMKSYLYYFDLLKEESQVLNDLYAPLKASLSQQGVHEQKLDFVCRVEPDTDAWLAKGAELFDLRKTGKFRYSDIQDIAAKQLSRAWRACDTKQIESALDQCLTAIKEADVVRTQLKAGFHPRDIAEWLFSVDHITVSYGIQYEGKDLRLLSPGTKGIVLLILYLAVDVFDTRPLIVDQPDENLDNLSTFEILRTYFREAKKRRQIIIITHNPNLVVNTDAEQVIVADSQIRQNGLPRISYSSGSLEAIAIDGPLGGSTRGSVCRIMEGGKDAFRMRENRYGSELAS